MIRELRITDEMAGRRLDESLALLAGISKGEARRIIDRGGCAVNQSMVRVASRNLKSADLLTVGIMQVGEFSELVLGNDAIVFEDANFMVVNKPSGVASQRTPYQLKGTMEYWVAEQFALQGIKEPVRVVHRLDRGTSGLLLFPKHRKAAARLSELFKYGRIHKRYLALVAGVPGSEEWVAGGAIGKIASSRWGVVPGGRTAKTEFRLNRIADGKALVEARPITGRTHQIRVHLSAENLPIVGDSTYNGLPASRLMLHCAELLLQGYEDEETVVFKVLPDDDFINQCGACWEPSLIS